MEHSDQLVLESDKSKEDKPIASVRTEGLEMGGDEHACADYSSASDELGVIIDTCDVASS